LVLLSVFVPIAFIPGVSGTLFRQFAVTISVAMLISAINALTLSPALCAVFLRHQGPHRGPMGWVLRRIDNVRDGYAAIVGRLVRVSALGVALVLACGAAIYGLSLRTPTGFLPEEDQGAFFIAMQLPDGASVSRTSEAVQALERQLRSMPAGPKRICDRRLLDHRRTQRAQRRLCRPHFEAVRRPRRGDELGAGADHEGIQ
jgi:multidrug efflux pump